LKKWLQNDVFAYENVIILESLKLRFETLKFPLYSKDFVLPQEYMNDVSNVLIQPRFVIKRK